MHEEHISSQVNVSRAERAFNALERVTSTTSRKELQRTSSYKNEKRDLGSYDEEKGELPPSEQPFDLREYLSSSNDKASAAGLKHKHVGVTWEDLQVEVNGGIDYKVRVIHYNISNSLLLTLLGSFTFAHLVRLLSNSCYYPTTGLCLSSVLFSPPKRLGLLAQSYTSE